MRELKNGESKFDQLVYFMQTNNLWSKKRRVSSGYVFLCKHFKPTKPL